MDTNEDNAPEANDIPEGIDNGIFPNPRPVPPELAHLYEGETDPLYMWPNAPAGELPW